MTAKVNEIGRTIQVGANFDLSGNSDLELTFTKPDDSTVTVNKVGGVSAPSVNAVDDQGNIVFSANTYFSFDTTTGFLDQTGNWQVNGQYIDLTPKSLCGDPAFFFVAECP